MKLSMNLKKRFEIKMDEKHILYVKKITDLLHEDFKDDGKAGTIILIQSLLHIGSSHPQPLLFLEKVIKIFSEIKADLEKKS